VGWIGRKMVNRIDLVISLLAKDGLGRGNLKFDLQTMTVLTVYSLFAWKEGKKKDDHYYARLLVEQVVNI
jgi:hypothetical protein